MSRAISLTIVGETSGQRETERLTGRFRQREGHIFILLEEGGRLSLREHEVTLDRNGLLLRFQEGLTHHVLYPTPVAPLPLSFRTLSLERDPAPAPGIPFSPVRISYELLQKEEVLSRHTLTIESSFLDG